MYIVSLKKGNKYWYGTIHAGNGHLLFRTPGSQTYSSKAMCKRMLKRFTRFLSNCLYKEDK